MAPATAGSGQGVAGCGMKAENKNAELFHTICLKRGFSFLSGEHGVGKTISVLSPSPKGFVIDQVTGTHSSKNICH